MLKLTYLYRWRLGVMGDPSLILSNWYAVGFPFNLSIRFLGGSKLLLGVDEVLESQRAISSVSSSLDGFLRLRSSNRKYITFSVLWLGKYKKRIAIISNYQKFITFYIKVDHFYHHYHMLHQLWKSIPYRTLFLS